MFYILVLFFIFTFKQDFYIKDVKHEKTHELGDSCFGLKARRRVFLFPSVCLSGSSLSHMTCMSLLLSVQFLVFPSSSLR